MVRKSRKNPELTVPVNKDAADYIRLSVLNRDSLGSVENQRLMIEEWGQKHQVPIMRYYIDNGFSGKRFDRPAFQGMSQDIQKGRIDRIVVVLYCYSPLARLFAMAYRLLCQLHAIPAVCKNIQRPCAVLPKSSDLVSIGKPPFIYTFAHSIWEGRERIFSLFIAAQFLSCRPCNR